MKNHISHEFTIQQLLDRLQACDECHHIETKESKTTLGKSAQETISAFSNEPGLGGGYLVLGVKGNDDVTGSLYSVVGVDDPDQIQRELANVCGELFNIQIRPHITVEAINGKHVVCAFIPEASHRNKPVFIKKRGVEQGSYRRIGSADHRCTAEDLDLLYQLRSDIPYEQGELSHTSWEDIDVGTIAAYRRRRSQINAEAMELYNLPKRCPNIRIRKIIKRLCALKPLQLTQLSKILHREPQSLRIHILSQMIKSGELVYAFPEQSAHPQQGYKTP